MPMTSTDRRNMKRHIALNKFYIEHPIGSEIDLLPTICACQKWKIGNYTCSCGKTYVHLDYSETANSIFPTSIPCAL